MNSTEMKQMEMVKVYRENPAAAARDLLGITLAPHQRVILKAMWDCDNVMLVLSRGGGKCIGHNTLCNSDKGYIKAEDLHKTENYGFNEDVINLYGENGFKATSHTYKNNPKQIYEVTTKFGYSQKSVDKHMVRCLKDGIVVWKRADELAIGDSILIDRSEDYNFNGEYDLSIDEGYLIGVLIGSGYFVKAGGIGFTNIDKDVLDQFYKFHHLLGATKFSSLKDKKEFCLLFGGVEKDNIFFDKYKLKREKANTKTIPESILQSNKNALAAFISGYADIDGVVTGKGVEFLSTSEELLKQLQVVLLSFGIIARRRYKEVKYKGGYKDAWILLIGSDNAKIFAEKIGFRCKRKQDKLKALVNDKIFNPNHDTLKGCTELLLTVRNEFKKHTVFGYNNPKYRIFSTTRIKSYDFSYNNLNKFLDISEELCSHMSEWKQLKYLLNKHYFIDTVKKVEVLPEEITYDVHIPDDHTFISNGFISHNTFIDAVFAVLRAMLFPGEKVGIFGPSYRQSKFVFAEVEKIYDMSPELRNLCTKKPVKGTDMCYLDFVSVGNKPGSVIHALPLGDGGKIRGARYFTVIGDEAAQIPNDILNIVVRGMMATSKNPMENVKWIKDQKRLLAEGKIDKITKLHHNKIVLSSTAYYQYNHFWERVKGYQASILDKIAQAKKLRLRGEPVPEELDATMRGHDLNSGQIPFNIMKDKDRALIAFNWEDFPEGFMSADSIREAEKDMPRYQFLMEYFAFFPPDSDGFFPRSLLDKAQSHRQYAPQLSLPKQEGIVNIMGIDPARSGDNFAIAIFKVNPKRKLVQLVRVLTYRKKTYPFMHLEIRRLMKVYNISEIAMDSGGGGTTIRDLLADEKSLPPGDDLILQRGFEEHQFMKGRRILELVEFSKYDWLHDANHNMLLSLQTGSLQIPCDKGSLITSDNFSETIEEENAYDEIIKSLDEVQNIVVTHTRGGRMHWDTPQKNQRKDRYSAIMIGHDMSYTYMEALDKPQQLASGFWS